MPFRDGWLIVGAALALIGFGASEPVITAVGFVIILIGGVSRYWNKHLFSRTTIKADLREPLRASPDDVLLHAAIDAAIARKPKGHDFVIGREERLLMRSMSVTGG